MRREGFSRFRVVLFCPPLVIVVGRLTLRVEAGLDALEMIVPVVRSDANRRITLLNLADATLVTARLLAPNPQRDANELLVRAVDDDLRVEVAFAGNIRHGERRGDDAGVSGRQRET
jgi:hypothetical protein